MAIYWRISNHADLSGEGGRIAGARWHTAGRRIVYLAESPAVAMLELLVHMEYDAANLPAKFTLLKISAPDALKVVALDPSKHSNWREDIAFTRALGDKWLAGGASALAKVPSAVAPHAWNYLLNPEHADAKQVRIDGRSQERLDLRLLRKAGSSQ